MKKSGKILFVSILMIMFMLAFSVSVKAADEIDYSGYEELEEEIVEEPTEPTPTEPTEQANPTQQAEPTETSEPKTEEQPTQEPEKVPAQESVEPAKQEEKPTTSTIEPTNKANTSTETHAKAGEFKTTIYTIGAGVFGAVLAIGYTKIKKYIF